MTPIKIALTGGPCSGKTTGMVRLQEHLERLGYRVAVVPETATIIFSGAGRPRSTSRAELVRYQKAILQTQLSLEENFSQLVQGEKIILLTDRSVMDGKAFLTSTEWQAVLDDLKLDEYQLLNRYGAVVHLVTAADGVPGAYRLEGVRNETPEQAVRQDHALQKAYLGHGHLKIVDNSTSFDDKMRRAIGEICRFLGEPEPLEIERKFLVTPPIQLPADCVTSVIEQTYLESEGHEEERVRKRTQGVSSIYTHARKKIISPGVRIEKEHSISGADYLEYLERADGTRVSVRKRRHCFIHNRRCYELDEYLGTLAGLWTLEIEVEDLQAPVSWPEWIQVTREVTDEPAYSNYQLALLNPTRARQVIGL